jgi:lipoprotein-anchoring transpeptidase ErfK/SrfK
MKAGKIAFASLGLALLLGGCNVAAMQETAPTTALKPRDKQLLAAAPYAPAAIPQEYQRHVVSWHRKELPGTVVVDTDARYLYYVMPEQKAIRYGVTVGEDALSWSGVAKIGRVAEWPAWTPTADIKKRLAGIPDHVTPGPHNPMGARAIYLYEGSKDTLFRIHGTNQPEYIGQAISSGCIRLTNEDVIDLYSRVKVGSPVVVLGPNSGDSPRNPRVAAAMSATGDSRF